MVSQGFFSGSEKRSKRLAGQKENKVALGGDNLGSVGAITAVGAIGSLGIKGIRSAIEGGKRLKENIEKRVNPERETSFFSPSGIEVGKVASSDLSSLRVDSPEVRIANVKSYTDSITKPYAPDTVESIIKDTKFPKTYTDTSGNIYDKSPYKSLFSDDNTPNDAKFLGRVGDDLNFSQPYNKRLGEDNFRKEQAGYLRSQGYDENTITRLSGDVPRTMGERTKNFFKGLFPGFRDTSEALTRFDVKEMPNYQKEYYDSEYKDFRKDMRDKVFSESSYGEDVERGTIGKPGYYYKDFQQPGVYRSQEDVKSYIKDRGAFMTGMPSNFEGGISGIGKKSDDLSSMYRSTAGDEKTRLEKAREEQENRNVFQKVGDAVGNVFNKLTGTEAAAAGTLQAQGINTGATVNLSRINNADSTVQRAREAVEKAVRQQTGMPSNPGSQRQKGVGESANNLSRHKAGPSTSRGGISRSTSRGQGGGSSSRSRGGVSRGGSRSNTGSKSSARGARGSSTSRSKGGTGSGRTSTSRTASKASRSRTGRSRTRCDIRTKIDISPLINSNLVKDNLAKVAYFVQEIKK